MTTPRDFPPHVREGIVGWFREFGNNAQMEIEFRVQDVQEAGFERLLAGLMANKGWSKMQQLVSLDKVHASGVRETIVMVPSKTGVGMVPSTDTAASFLRKTKVKEATLTTPSDYSVRFAVASETECSADTSPVHVYRHKQRVTFVHKDLFKFELTRVKQGSTDQAAIQSEMQFEVELEFCGQNDAAVARPEYLADSLLMKAAGMLQQLARARSGDGPAAATRVSAAEGPLKECEAVVLASGTEVALEPSSHGQAARFDGEMPAEFAERVAWLFSHREEASGQTCIMSEPTHLGNQHYPLFYFVGRVPTSAVQRRPPRR